MNRIYRVLALVVGALGLWWLLKPDIFPSPLDIVLAIPRLFSDGFSEDIISSLITNLEALVVGAVIGLPISYFSRVPSSSFKNYRIVTSYVEELALFLGELRNVGSAVFYLPLMLFVGPHWVKVWLLALGEIFFLVASMKQVVDNIPQERFDDAYTLRMSDWQTCWYVIIRGTLADAIDTLKINAGMGWSMLMFVEGIVRSEGGIGVVIMNAEKHVDYDVFFAAVSIIIALGIMQSKGMVLLRKWACPYA
jgi:NitT/TauT family transport system permease protein